MFLYHVAERDFTQLNRLGVAIREVDAEQRHVGMLYRIDQGEVRLCHFAWHLDLRDQLPAMSYLWAEAGLDPLNQRVIALQCARIARGGTQIPYGLRMRGICFDGSNGRYIPQESGRGLTCATFIMAVLRSVGFELLDENSWPARPQDVEWQRAMLELMRQNGALQEHVDAMEADVGASRYRPEEVAGAITRTEYPVSFEDACALASEILRMLTAAR